MKFRSLFFGDIRFQYRYGFYLVYAIFTLLYISISLILPQAIKTNIVLLMIFSDPTIIGLMFTGAMIHLELDEKTFQALMVSPIDYKTYTLSKLLSFSVISLIVSFTIGLATQTISHVFLFSLSIVLGSMIFTSFGLMLAFVSKSLNQFILYMIPVMIVVMIPGAYDLLFDGKSLLLLHPGVAIVRLLSMQGNLLGASLSLILWSILAVGIALIKVKKAFRLYGGNRYASNI